MTDVIVPAKKLKQARLSFGKLPLSKSVSNQGSVQEHKVHQLQQVQPGSHNDKENVYGANEIQVKVDVHATIQCPEISTSIHSDSDIETKVESKVDQNIDDAISTVIHQAVNQKEAFIESSLLRDSKKRRRSKSPKPDAVNKSEADTLEIEVSKSLFMSSAGISSAPVVIVESPNDNESRPKKPRRSVLEMLNTSKNGEKQMDTSADDNAIEVIDSDSEPNNFNKSNEKANTPQDTGKIMDVEFPANISVENVDNNLSNNQKDVSPAKGSSITRSHSLSPPSVKKQPSPKQRSARKTNSEVIKKKEEREQEREERKKLKEEEKHLKEMEKLEQKKKKEEEKAQREEEKRKKKEELDRIKEDKLKKKQEEQDKKKAEQEAKRLEKERKEEERIREKEKKEEERKQKELEKQRILEEKQKSDEEKKRIKEKQASTFKNFFTSPSSGKRVLRRSIGDFVQFQLKEDMFLAPSTRKTLSSSRIHALDSLLKNQIHSELYVHDIKAGKRKLEKSASTIPHKRNKLLSLTDDGLEVIAMDENSVSSLKPLKAKFLQFSENNRPPYFGTWRKSSKVIKGKSPFQKDNDLFDYDVDSDDEWEDPGEGEDIANSDGEEEIEKDEDEDEGDGFFVPHGYLSDDEGIDADGEENDVSEQKLKMKQQEFENSFKQKIKVLTPLIIGCVWPDIQENVNKRHLQTLDEYKIMLFDETQTSIDLDSLQTPVPRTPRVKAEVSKPPKQPRNVPDEAMPDLIRMLHGNPHSAQRLVKEFQAYWQKANESKMAANTDTNMETGSNCTSTDKEVSDILVPPPPPGFCKSRGSSPHRPQSVSPKPGGKIGEISANGSLADVTIFTPVDKGPFWIPKSQVLKKIKEIGVYGRRETLSRSCWFVLDDVFQKYSLDREKFLIPCTWEYITKVPDIKLGLLVDNNPPTSTEAKESAPVVAKMNINKFTAKVSAEALLSNCIKRGLEEKEKQGSQTSNSSINIFATSKVSAEELIESSRQKFVQEQQEPRRVELTTIALGNTQAWEEMNEVPPHTTVYGVPTHDAFKNFFGMQKEESRKDNVVENVAVELVATKLEAASSEGAKANKDEKSGRAKSEVSECMVVD